jgi:chromosome partitioning protein
LLKFQQFAGITTQPDQEVALIVTVASFKGGQAKTTTAVHLAALFNTAQPTLLVDGDPNRSATSWNRRKGFPFRVVDEKQAVRFAREFEHVVIDTQARPTEEDLKELAGGCDLLIVPLTPDALSLDTLFLFTDALARLGANRFKILLTIVPPAPQAEPGRGGSLEHVAGSRASLL